MLSAVIPSAHSYSAMPLAEQQIHQRCVHFGPLVLKMTLLNFPTPATDRDQTVSRRSEPSSRTALIGEQPNPWDLLQPQDAMSRGVPFVRLAMALPLGTTGSLRPAFAPARDVSLAVKPPYAFILYYRFLFGLR